MLIKKVPDVSGLVTITVLNTEIGEVKNKTPNHNAYITTQELNKSTAENFKERLKQALIKKFNSNKAKYLKKKVNSLVMVLKICLFINQTLIR